MGDKKLFGFLVMFIFIVLFVSFVSAGGNDCWQYSGSFNGTNQTCSDAGCRWETNATDPFCDQELGCCMDKGCMEYTTPAECNSTEDSFNCSWDSYMKIWYPNGSLMGTGGCVFDFSEGGGDWGMSDGCWNNDANKMACDGDTNCKWKKNDANQNPWCWIKNINDAQNKNPFALATDVGCCDQKGCWDYDGNETACVQAFNGLCWYDTFGGWCNQKSCSEISDETNCSYAKMNLMMPCDWNGSACQDFGGGAGGDFGFYNDSDSCLSNGGWYNMSGDCNMPTDDFGGGGGGFMFGDGAHCWFADNKPGVCNNITGCAYCTNGTGPNGIANVSSNNICKNAMVGFCEGHVLGDSIYANADNTNNLNCSHIKLSSACKYGPLPNCKWSNSSTTVGSYCVPGKSDQKSAPPVSYCEDPVSKNNYTLCMQLANVYMMPCKWDNSSAIVKNCTFNSNAVFGSGNGKEFETITSEGSCTAAGGTWTSEYYIDAGTLKQDAWCEKGAIYDAATGSVFGNKGNCDTDCIACEFESNGSVPADTPDAQARCEGSQLGYCKFKEDSNAPNGFGWCDYPKQMDFGAGDCNTNCKDCGMKKEPYNACISSVAGCKWVNNTDSVTGLKVSEGSCVAEGKKTCDIDCFACSDFNECNATSIGCQWDSGGFCKPSAFSGEICFDTDSNGNPIDNDGDGLANCNDPDCSFDMTCGGNNFADCAKYKDLASCNAAVAFGTSNCTWINMSWEPVGHCGMPGENCWLYDGNASACGAQAGCTNSSSKGATFCDINQTKIDSANCWQYKINVTCNGAPNCVWKQPDFGPGFCDFWLFSNCGDKDKTSCESDGNCTWKYFGSDPNDGFCDVACFNDTLDNNSCAAVPGGICEWRGAGDTCMPEFFDDMGGRGCAENDGNQTACLLQNFTCVWHDDSRANNNVSDSEPSGWCDSIGDNNMNGNDMKDIILLGDDLKDAGVLDYLDLDGFGMKVTDNAYGFGVHMWNITDSVVCNGYPLGGTPELDGAGVGVGIKTNTAYFYLDTNNVKTGGCNAIDENGVSYPGYEFYLYYRVENKSTGIETTKQLFQCKQNSTGSYVWNPTNVFVSDNKKFTCFETGGAIFVSVEKESMENFDTFNITLPMRIFAVSGNGSARVDSVGPSYYTPGTIDFGFVDCSNPDTKDPKCKVFNQFGFQTYEECKNGVDDDADGLSDCDDPKCVFTPHCASGSAFNWTSIDNDYKAPLVMFSQVDKMADAAIVMFDTDEPANGTVVFYKNASSCTGTPNMTLYDVGDAEFTFDDYKPFHRVSLDSDTLGYSLVNTTTYYYKVKVCDPFSNCGVSKCLNFTTRKANKNFIFRMDVPDGYTVDIPALNYSGNFTQQFGSETFDVGLKTNSSVTRNINMTIHCGDLDLTFFGVDLFKPKTINLNTAFICNETQKILGMNSSSKSWHRLLNDLGLGGANDYIQIDFPVAYSTSNDLQWCDDTLTNCSDVNDYVNCSSNGATQTRCKIPTSIGFSAYQVDVPAATTPTSDNTPSSSSSGSAGTVSYWTTTYTGISSDEFTKGYSKELAIKKRVKVIVSSETHYVGVVGLTATTATINVSSTPQQAVFSVGDSKKFDVNSDNYYDILVTLNGISNSKANITIKTINEEYSSDNSSVSTPNKKDSNIDTTPTGEAVTERTDADVSDEEGSNLVIWIVLIIVGVGIIGFFVYWFYILPNTSKKKKKI